jgi:N-formylmaleamate deformylase
MIFTSNTIQANGITHHYYRSGGDKRPLVLMHGFTDDGACWFPFAEPLTQDYDVIMPDARAHGQSARVAGIGFSNEALADDAAAFIQALALDRPAVMGHSMGAFNAMITAAKYPDLIRCLMLEDPPLLPPPGEGAAAARRPDLREWGNNLHRMQETPLEDLIADDQQRSPRWSDAELRLSAESKYRVDADVFEAHAPMPPWELFMQRVQCPVLLLYGDTTFIDDTIAQEAASLWKTGQAVKIAQAGHCIHRDNLADSLQAAQTFLRENYAG